MIYSQLVRFYKEKLTIFNFDKMINVGYNAFLDSQTLDVRDFSKSLEYFLNEVAREQGRKLEIITNDSGQNQVDYFLKSRFLSDTNRFSFKLKPNDIEIILTGEAKPSLTNRDPKDSLRLLFRRFDSSLEGSRYQLENRYVDTSANLPFVLAKYKIITFESE